MCVCGFEFSLAVGFFLGLLIAVVVVLSRVGVLPHITWGVVVVV
jgi:hypothetical protein